MENIQIVIDIPEETYKEIKEGFYDKNTRKMAIAIGNGIQLLKDHGRIGDLDEILVWIIRKGIIGNLKCGEITKVFNRATIMDAESEE